MRDQLTKEQLYEGVKSLVENTESHIIMDQHKLYTLVSIAFQYLLFTSTKNPGFYLIRTEDHPLFDKMVKKAKDPTTRKFLQRLGDSRKLKYGKSTFILDYFQMSSWSLTNDLAKSNIKAAMIVKNAGSTPFGDSLYLQELAELKEEGTTLPNDHFLKSLMSFVPKTITIAYEQDFEGTTPLRFPWIKRTESNLAGVKISEDLNINSDPDSN